VEKALVAAENVYNSIPLFVKCAVSFFIALYDELAQLDER
jgi:hypothetical protein